MPPISSHQISALIAGQQQQSMMQQQQAMALSPTAIPALGQSQFPPAMAMGGAPMPAQFGGMTAMGAAPMGAFGAQSGFSYGLQPGPGLGAMAAAPAVGMAGSVPSFMGSVTGAAGLASMFGVGGSAVGALGMLDPLGAAMSAGQGAFGVGGRLGLGMAGRVGMGAAAGTGVGALVMGGMEAARFGGQHAMAGFQQQQSLNAQLGQFTFANMGAPTGRGFGFQQMGQIGQAMRGFAAADPFTSMQDMSSMMQQFTEMGMAQGVRDAEEFSNRFTRMVDTVRSMAMAMGTSIQEASQAFGQMRQAGFFTSADVMGNTNQMMMLRGMGMSRGQFGAMQAQAAAASRGEQMSGRAGAQAATNLASMFMMRPELETQLMDITGGANLAESSAMLSQQTMQQGSQFLLRSGGGRAMLAALGQQEGGRFTGGINQELMGRLTRGEVGISELSRMGRQQMSAPGARQSFMHRQRDIAGSMMQQEDFLPAIMQAIRQEGRGDEDVEALLAEQLLGMDRRTFDVMREQIDQWQQVRRERRNRLEREIQAEALQAEIARNRSFGGIRQRITGTIEGFGQRTFGQLGADIATEAGVVGQDITDTLFGIQRVGVTAGGIEATTMRAAATGHFEAAAAMGIPGAEDFGQRRFGGAQGLLGAIAGRGGGGAAISAAGMAAAGNIGDMGTVLGVPQSRQDQLRKATGRLRGNRRLRNLISQAQTARQKGKTGEVRRLQRQIDDEISAVLPSETRMGVTGRNQNKVDRAFILSELGGSSLVTEQLQEEAGQAGLDVYSATAATVHDLEMEARKDFGEQISTTGAVSFVGAVGLTKTLLGESAGAIAHNLLIGQVRESAIQEIVEGGPGANVLAAISGKEDEFLELRAQAEDIKDPDARREFLLGRMQQMTGRGDITMEDVEKAFEISRRDTFGAEGMLEKLTGYAAKAEASRIRPEQAAAMVRAFTGESLSGLEKEARDVALASAKGGGIKEIRTLVEAATKRGDLTEIAASGRMGQAVATAASAVRRVEEGKITTRGQLAEAMGLEEEAVTRFMEQMDEGTRGDLGEVARRLATGAVATEASQGITGMTFRGQMDPEVQRMQLAQQIQANSEMIAYNIQLAQGKEVEPPTMNKGMTGQPLEGQPTRAGRAVGPR